MTNHTAPRIPAPLAVRHQTLITSAAMRAFKLECEAHGINYDRAVGWVLDIAEAMEDEEYAKQVCDEVEKDLAQEGSIT